MKSLFFKTILITSIIIMASYNSDTNQTEKVMSDVMLENVEALANYEIPEIEITCNENDYTSPGQCWMDDGDCFRLMQYYRACRFCGYQYMYCTSICNL